MDLGEEEEEEEEEEEREERSILVLTKSRSFYSEGEGGGGGGGGGGRGGRKVCVLIESTLQRLVGSVAMGSLYQLVCGVRCGGGEVEM